MGAQPRHALDQASLLADLLRGAAAAAGDAFTGTGLVVCDRPELLPILPLRHQDPDGLPDDLVQAIAAISRATSAHHDGFHILSSTGTLLKIAQYFSPPIVVDAPIDRSRLFGGRYLAALFGSALPHVLRTGIASREFGLAVFEQGAERLYESAL